MAWSLDLNSRVRRKPTVSCLVKLCLSPTLDSLFSPSFDSLVVARVVFAAHIFCRSATLQQLAGAKGDGAVQFDERSIFLLSEEGEWLYRAPDANYKESVNVISKRKFKAAAKTDKPSGFSAR